jgi:hypothetical protein
MCQEKTSDPEKIVEKIRNAENLMIRTIICRDKGKYHAEEAEKREGPNKQRRMT